MNRIIVALCAVLLALAQSALADTPSTVGRPDVRVGDQWTYRTSDGWTSAVTGEGTISVVSVGSVVELMLKSKSGAETHVVETRDTNTMRRVSSNGYVMKYLPDSGRMIFPLQVGNTWDTRSSVEMGVTKKVREDLHATVVGWEDVVVPAGTFSALKITWTGYYNSSDGAETGNGGKVEITLWYSPGVKRSVKYIYKEWDSSGHQSKWNVTELLAYQSVTKRVGQCE